MPSTAPGSSCLAGLALAVIGLVVPAVQGQGIDVEDQGLEQWAASRLAASFDAISSDLLEMDQVLVPELEIAFGLAQIATELDPSSSDAWRSLLDVSTLLGDDMEGAADSRRRALEALVKLDPRDSVVRLRLLLDRIDARPTAQERIAAYETLLTPENIDRLGAQASARLAFDLGLLQMRVGDTDAAATRVAQAVMLDPSFPQAAEMAAGIFRTVVPTPIDEAELLAIAWTASPSDEMIARVLGQLVLADGAFESAADILELAILLLPENTTNRASLIADRMLALWGADRAELALELFDRETRSRLARRKRVLLQEGYDPEEVKDLEVPPAPELALITAVIEARRGDPERREQAVTTLFRSFDFEQRDLARRALRMESDEDIPEERKATLRRAGRKRQAELYADEAWARAWFGWKPATAAQSGGDEDSSELLPEVAALTLKDLLDGAVKRGVLEPGQRNVVEGWEAISQDDFDRARLLLVPAAESSPYAEAGLALLDEVEGRRKEAARRYLDVFESRPGTLVGLWSRSRLEGMLGVEIPAPERAALMDEMLAATLPEAVGRAIRDPRHGVLAVRVEPTSLRQAAYGPLLIDVTLTNVSGLNLAIGPESPISPTVAIVADVADVVGLEGVSTALRQSRPVVVSIDRRFSLAPEESIELQIDLTRTRYGRYVALASIFGGSFKIRAVANFGVSPSGNITTGVFGREGLSPVFRVDGLNPLADDRYRRMAERMQSADSISDAKDVAALLELVLGTDPRLTDDEIRLQAIDAALALPPLARAWAMSHLPAGVPGSSRLVDRLVNDGSRASLALGLARFSLNRTSAPINAGLRSDDPLIRRMAEAAQELSALREQRDLNEVELDLGSGS